MVDFREGDEPEKLRWKPDVGYVNFDADPHANRTNRNFYTDFVEGKTIGPVLQRQIQALEEGEWIPSILPAPLIMGHQRTPAAATPHHERPRTRAGIKVAVGDEVNKFINF